MDFIPASKCALHCMDGKLQLGAIPAIFAGSRDITREGTISITQAELIQENYCLQNFNKLL